MLRAVTDEGPDGPTDGSSGPAPAKAAPAKASLDELADWLEREHAGLIRFAYLVSGDAHSAQDLVQEAFVLSYRAGIGMGPTTGAYFRRTIVNTWRSALRRRLLEQRFATLNPTPLVSTEPGEPDLLWERIKQLPTRQRAVLALRYYEDLSERETADVLGISLGSVKKHASRAIEQLRQHPGRWD